MRWIVIVGILIVGCTKPESKPEKKPVTPKTEYKHLNIEVKDFGLIKVELYPDYAPKNVANIITLTQKGYYNGLTFHRIVPGFVIQGGCPRGDGTGDPGYEIADEITPELKHKRGTVAMANRGPNTNGSQFYICLLDLPRLDGRYTIFGRVIEGMQVVDKIAQVKTGPKDRPLEQIIMEKVWVEP
ncbi:MAG TPA: peptidylprolyl isomerase [bacterium (Candidatus Stahlbacteria)]|nr:peptidylprolyl isomerase [Candidatus Stahlbacteria bacterium]